MNTRSANASRAKRRLRQRGVSLFEALVSVLLVGITGMGLVAITTQVLSTQRYATTENQVLLGLREALLEEPGVASVNVAGSTIGFTRDPQTLQLTVRMGTVEKTVSLEADTLVVTDDPDGLIGGDGRFQLGY